MPRFRIDAGDIARMAVFAAIIAALGLPGAFSLFGGVPITAQTLGVMLAGAVLGPWRGALSVLLFEILVAIGLPLLAGGKGGAAVFVGPTAGYLIGWIFGAFVIGLIVHARPRLTWGRTIAGIVIGGIPVIYAFGIPVQSLVTRLPIADAALMNLVFLPGDAVKVAIAAIITMTLVKAYPRAFRKAGREREREPELVSA